MGVFVGDVSYVHFKAILWGTERKMTAIIGNPAMVGLSVSFMLFGGVSFLASVGDHIESLKISVVLRDFALFVAPGFIGFLVSLWRYYMVSLGRDQLINTIISKIDDKK